MLPQYERRPALSPTQGRLLAVWGLTHEEGLTCGASYTQSTPAVGVLTRTTCALESRYNFNGSFSFLRDSVQLSDILLTPLELLILSCFRYALSHDISRFFPRMDRIFSGEALYLFFGAQDEGFSEFRSR